MTRQVQLWSGWGAAVALAVGLPLGLHAVSGLMPQTRQASPDIQIPSLSEPGETLQIRERSADTGLVTFAASEGRGILVSVQANAPTETRARSFVAQYGTSFGVADQSQLGLARQPAIDSLGVEHVRFQQQHYNVPVVAGELLVHLKGSRVMAANGRMLPVTRMPDTTPQITDAEAVVAARALIDKKRAAQARGVRYLAPKLQILNRGLLADGTFPSHLAWFVEAAGPGVREYIWVDAHMGGVVLHFSQLTHARDRRIYDANNTNVLPGTLKRIEGQGPTGDVEEDALYNMLGATYDYYFTQHARDSYNGAGAPIVASVDWTEPGGCPNAFWDGSITQMALCDGLVADDVVHHEFTHAVTEYTAGLFYFNQSGALNESFSDIFGETIDLTDGIGNDTAGVRWQIGEDVNPASGLPIPLRHMMTPNPFGNPGKMSDPEFECDPFFDGGGVHINSGVPNHAYALMVDGGTFNGHTITGIGLTKAGKIQYRALSVYLSSGSNFKDAYDAVNQSCVDLIGTTGITVADCTQVVSALRAVEMHEAPMCANYTTPPALCANGSAPASTVFSDNFEVFPPAQWTASSTSTTQWGIGSFWGDGGLHAFGPASGLSIHNFNMAASVVIPPNAKMYFDHAFWLEDQFDAGVVEYSNNAGATWNSAQALIEAGQTYNMTLFPDNPLGAVQAFSGDSYGFTGTRLNLSTLQGQSVRFRFRVANDPSVAYYGWSVDNVRIYTCAGDPTGNMVMNGDFANGGTPPGTPPANWFVFSAGTAVEWNTVGGTFNYRRPAGNTQGVILQQTGIPLPAFTSVMAMFTMGNTDPARKRFSVLIHDADFSDLSVCTFWLDPGAVPQLYMLTTHTTKAWTNATISIYAANTGVGGFYQLDNVMMMSGPAVPVSTEMTQCIDPAAPVAGGVSSGELLVNGTFTGGTIAPWFTFGQIQSQLNAGVFEFFKLAGTPAGLISQQTGQAMVQDQRIRATFQLGNSSALRQRVTVLIHDSDFSDLHACTFILPPGLLLSTFAMRTYTTEAWPNAQIAFYPATVGTSPTHEWLRVDNVSVIRTTNFTTGTECYEPGDVPGPGFTGKR